MWFGIRPAKWAKFYCREAERIGQMTVRQKFWLLHGELSYTDERFVRDLNALRKDFGSS
jgi:hypothetical protein